MNLSKPLSNRCFFKIISRRCLIRDLTITWRSPQSLAEGVFFGLFDELHPVHATAMPCAARATRDRGFVRPRRRAFTPHRRAGLAHGSGCVEAAADGLYTAPAHGDEPNALCRRRSGAAVYKDGLAGDVGACRRCEHDRRTGDFIRLAKTAERECRLALGAQLGVFV